MKNQINYLQLLRYAVRTLQMPASEFWRLTLKEFMAIAQDDNQQVSNLELKKLKAQFPDTIDK
jgi:hypothetical protein